MLFLPKTSVAATLPASLSFIGKTILITGGTSGLGLAAATHYIRLGASRVIITARDVAKGATAKAAIEAATSSIPTPGIVEVRLLDMNTFSKVKKFMDELRSEVKEIDVVLLNAGVLEFSRRESPDGWEIDLQVNTLSTTLLGLLMIPWMRSLKREGIEQHLTFIGSRSHTAPNILVKDWPKNDILKYWNEEKNYQPGDPSYSLSKLFLHYAINEIAALAAADVDNGIPSPIISTVCPGAVRTDLSQHFAARGMLQRAVIEVFLFVRQGLTPLEGAKALVLATTVNASENGKFMVPGLSDEEYVIRKSRNMTSESGKAMQVKVWSEMIHVLEEAVPSVKSVVRKS